MVHLKLSDFNKLTTTTAIMPTRKEKGKKSLLSIRAVTRSKIKERNKKKILVRKKSF